MDTDSPHAAGHMQPDRFVRRHKKKEKRWKKGRPRGQTGHADQSRPRVGQLAVWLWVFASQFPSRLFPTFFHHRSISIIGGICPGQLGRLACLGSRKGRRMSANQHTPRHWQPAANEPGLWWWWPYSACTVAVCHLTGPITRHESLLGLAPTAEVWYCQGRCCWASALAFFACPRDGGFFPLFLRPLSHRFALLFYLVTATTSLDRPLH
ncbi:hypothetical protein MAPG_10427 [Magnaporthiopsis poae ATCC 64411]|uniref:Uncharacterized protein n=1 Tax=Magnaporthiopsis poae (strain ATCC 64411 / 73-15) TaxID=644358 RepID=A0A0C4ECJ9_MAGP6|nr:hypothetical protein MAPG_10427 [Magnaporthiopsis poae ATCC 64411]